MAGRDTDVIIIGAGSTGLLLAQGLRAAQIPFRIFERHASDYVAREWSMSLHWGGEFLTRVLPDQLRKSLPEINVDPNYDFSEEKGYIQCNGETGEVLLVMPGVMPRRVSRRKLRLLMSEGLDIEHEKELDDFTVSTSNGLSAVTASFKDNSTVTARVLVGADGSRSRTRHLMLRDPQMSALIQTPYSIINFPYSYSPQQAAEIRGIHPVFKVGYHPTAHAMFMSSLLSAADPETGYVTFQNLISWKGAPYPEDLADRKDVLLRFKDIGSRFAAPYKAAALGVPDDFREVFVDRGVQWDPRAAFKVENGVGTWNGNKYGGHVTLAGDAAHPMLPHRGQGLNNALEDASRLLTALTSALKSTTTQGSDPQETTSLEAAISAYETEMVNRGGLEVEVTAKAAAAAHDWNMLMQSPMFRHGANKTQ